MSDGLDRDLWDRFIDGILQLLQERFSREAQDQGQDRPTQGEIEELRETLNTGNVQRAAEILEQYYDAPDNDMVRYLIEQGFPISNRRGGPPVIPETPAPTRPPEQPLGPPIEQSPPSANPPVNEDDFRDEVEDANRDVDAIITAVLDVVTGAISSDLDDLTRIVTQSNTSIIDLISTSRRETDQLIGEVFGSVVDVISGQSGILDEILDFVSGQVQVTIINELILSDQIFVAIAEGYLDVIREEHRHSELILDTVIDGIRGVIQDQLESEIIQSNEIAEAIRQQTESEDTADDRMYELVESVTEGETPGIGRALIEGMQQWVDSVSDGRRSGVSDEWLRGFSNDVFQSCDAAELSAWIESKGVIEGTAGKLVYEIMEVIGKAMGLISIGTALGQKELAEFSRCTPWQILQVGDAITAYHHKDITYEELKLELSFNGFSEARSEALIGAGRTIPDLASLYSMNLRGFPQAANLPERIEELGFDPQDAEALADMKFYIPPPQDLITMAVREVFDPEAVRLGKKDENFPEEFAFWAEKQGINRFWSEKYWQGHWVLPSVQMAFEMLHRREITEDDLRRLMGEQDIMPGWREQLIAISYAPYTRVDIRRMHRLGVLTDEQVFEAYLDIGYNDERAQNLTEFTILDNVPDDNEDVEALEGLTRASVINAYKDGLIDQATADDIMKEAGIGEAARGIYLATANIDIEATVRKDELQVIYSQYEVGAMNLIEALSRLSTLNLTEAERSKAALKLETLTAKNIKLPSKADLDKMFAAGIIDEETYREQMDRIGYPDVWVTRYLELINLKGVENEGTG